MPTPLSAALAFLESLRAENASVPLSLPPEIDYTSLAKLARSLGYDTDPADIAEAFRITMRARALAAGVLLPLTRR